MTLCQQTNEELAGLVEDLRRRLEELAKTNAHLKQQLENFQAVADFTYDCETWFDPDNKVAYISPACERISGYKREEFEADPSLVRKIVHPEDRGKFQEHLQRGCGGKNACHLDFRIISKHGEERWISHYCQKVYGENSAYLGRRSSNRDITERKRAEIELERANRALKVLSECNKAMVRSSQEKRFLYDVCRILVDTGGYMMAWVGSVESDEDKSVRPVAEAGFENGYLESAKITWSALKDRGRGPIGTAIRRGEAVVCKNMLTDPEFTPWRAEALKRGYASMISLPVVVENQTAAALSIYAAEPDAFDMEEMKLLQELADDLAFGMTAIRARAERTIAQNALKEAYGELELRVKKRTEELATANAALKERAEELVQSNLELQRFAFAASHDLQEPLRKILMFGDLLRTRHADALDSTGRQYLERIQAASFRMTALINGILCHAKASSEDRTFAPVDLAEIAKDALAGLKERVEATGARVDLGELPIIDAEASQMKQLFHNLLSNALKFHREDAPPVVRIYAEAESGNRTGNGNRWKTGLYKIFFKDNGIGFHEKDHERLFSPFQRLHGRKFEGTGMGLAICRKIVTGHGGTITARSSPGEGSTFIVTLPARSGPK